MKSNQFVPEHDLTTALLIDSGFDSVNDQVCENGLNDIFVNAIQNNQKCFIDQDFYDHALEYWIEEVEFNSPEYFSNDFVQHWHSLLKLEFPKTTFNEFFLLERDPYIELLKELKHYLILLDMIETDGIEPQISLDTVSYLSYTISNRIRSQLESCMEQMPANVSGDASTPEERTIKKMVTTYKILLSTLNQHFANLLERIAEPHGLKISIDMLLNPDDIFEGHTDHETRMEVSIVPLLLHMFAVIF